jgi:hypothetical protein
MGLARSSRRGVLLTRRTWNCKSGERRVGEFEKRRRPAPCPSRSPDDPEAAQDSPIAPTLAAGNRTLAGSPACHGQRTRRLHLGEWVAERIIIERWGGCDTPLTRRWHRCASPAAEAREGNPRRDYENRICTPLEEGAVGLRLGATREILGGQPRYADSDAVLEIVE